MGKSERESRRAEKKKKKHQKLRANGDAVGF